MVCLLFCNGDMYARMCVCVSVCIFLYSLYKKRLESFQIFLPKVNSQSEKQPGKLSLEDINFKTTKADENREAEWKTLCKFKL